MRRDFFCDEETPTGSPGKDLVLFTGIFSRLMLPKIPRAALRVLQTAGCTVHAAGPPDGRPLCCGRTYLAVDMIDKARAEARRMIDALLPHFRDGRPIVGLESSCPPTLRDGFQAHWRCGMAGGLACSCAIA